MPPNPGCEPCNGPPNQAWQTALHLLCHALPHCPSPAGLQAKVCRLRATWARQACVKPANSVILKSERFSKLCVTEVRFRLRQCDLLVLWQAAYGAHVNVPARDSVCLQVQWDRQDVVNCLRTLVGVCAQGRGEIIGMFLCLCVCIPTYQPMYRERTKDRRNEGTNVQRSE